MKLKIDNNSSSDFTDIPSDVSSANGSAEITEMLRKGIKSAQDGNRAEARHLLMQVTELEPKNENAWLWLASISEYPEELLIFLSNVLSVNPKNERALEWEKSTKALLSKTFVQRGIEASKESQSAFAKQSFLQAIVHDDKNEMAWLWLASITSEIDEKKSHLQKVLNINPKNETALSSLKAVKMEMAETLLRKAQNEAISGNNESAGKMLDDILNHAPELEDAWLLKCFLTDSFSAKMNYFEKIVEINPENEAAVSSLAAMKSVMERSTPKSASDPVKSPAQEKAKDIPTLTEDVLDLIDLQESKPVEMPTEMFQTANDYEENISYVTNVVVDSKTQDSKTSDEAVQKVEKIEENSPQQIEGVEEAVQMKVEVSEDSMNEETEMDLAFAKVQETQESFFKEIQQELDKNEQPAQEVSEMPLYNEVIEEKESYEEQKHEEATEEFQYFKETVIEEKTEEIFEQKEEISEDQVQVIEQVEEKQQVEETVELIKEVFEKQKGEMVSCPFCKADNEHQNFICHSCHAMLTLSDVEMLLGHQEADLEIVQEVVERMESEHSIKNFDAEGLKTLGIGLLNLKNLRKGFEYLQEAAYLNPNDVLLNSQVNSLAIRLSEIEEQKSHHSPMPKNKTILVVDDSATVRKLITGKLEKSGLEVICAVDGMDALEKINESIPDLILLDITMPRMDGYQVCKMIRGNEATKDVPVVMISGKDGFFDKVRGRMAGTTGYITKPFGPETLMKTIEAYIE